MDTILYVNKSKEHLANPATYKEFDSNPTQAIQNDSLSAQENKNRHHLMPRKPDELFCGMVDLRKAFSLTSNRDHCQRFSPSRIFDMSSHNWYIT